MAANMVVSVREILWQGDGYPGAMSIIEEIIL